MRSYRSNGVSEYRSHSKVLHRYPVTLIPRYGEKQRAAETAEGRSN